MKSAARNNGKIFVNERLSRPAGAVRRRAKEQLFFEAPNLQICSKAKLKRGVVAKFRFCLQIPQTTMA